MFRVYINLDGNLPYNLCTCNDLLALWSVVEALIGDGTKGVPALGIVRAVEGQEPVIYRPPAA